MSAISDKPVTQIVVRPDPKAVDNNPGMWGEDGFTFADLIDVINPLQHIPFVSTIYREITGDEISKGARMIGGTILGGAIGFAAAAVNSAVEAASGMDIGENVMAMFGAGKSAEDKPIETALADGVQAAKKDTSPTSSSYDNPPPSPYNKKASKLYQQRERITEVEQLARFERQRLNVEA